MSWDEPLSGYEGVLARSKYPYSDSDNTYIVYIVELMHPNEQRRITLWQNSTAFGQRAVWKKYSRQLGLPALWQDKYEYGEEYTRRDPDDLDKSVRELVAEGKLEFTFDPAAAVPDELKLDIQGDQLEIVIGTSKTPLWVTLIVMLLFFPLPASFLCVGLTGNIFFGILGIFIGMRMIRALKETKETSNMIIPLVRIKREGLHILGRTPEGETKGRHIRADAIENVRVGKKKKNDVFPSVLVDTYEGSHAIGEGLDKDTLEWLRNCILNKVVSG
jgi:hypothetical protein